MENRISIVLPPEVSAAFHAKMLEAANLIKPYMVDVTDKGKEPLLKVGDILTPFIKKCLDYTGTDPEYVPKYLDVEEFARDTAALLIMDGMNSAIDKVNAGIDDTRALLANDAYAEATAYYRSVRDAARSGDAKAKVIYEDLSKWFTKGSSKAPGGGKTN